MDMEEVKVEEEVKNVIISVTSDAVKPKGTVRRNSTGKANIRASPSLLNNDEKLLPHYLRASTSSCHEFCKYGRKHVFEPKERKPKFLRSSVPDEKQKTEASNIRVRKRPELKVKTTSQPKDGLLDKPKGIKKNGLKEIQLSGTHAVEENESFEASESKKLQTPSPSQGHNASFEHSPFSEGEESFEEPASIKTDTLSPAHQIGESSDLSDIMHLESSSPTEKRVISHEPGTPLTCSDRLSDGSESMELEMPSPIHTPKDQLEGSSEERLGVEIMTVSPGTESILHPDETIISKLMIPTVQKSLKAKLSPRTQRSITAKARPTREEKSSGKGLRLELKIPSPNRRSVDTTEERNLTNKLKSVEGKKREESKLKTKPQLKTVSDRAKVTRQLTVTKKRTLTPVEETTGTSSKPEIAEQKSPPSVQKVILSVSPRVTKQKITEQRRSLSSVKKVILSVSPRVTKQKITEQRRSLSSVKKAIGSMSLGVSKQKITEQKSPSSVKKVIVSVSPQVTKKKASPTIKMMDTPARPSISLKPRTLVVKSTPTLISLRRPSSLKQTGNKIARSADLSKLRESPVLKPSRASMTTKPSIGGETESLKLMKSRNPKSSSPAKIQRKVGKTEDTNEKVKEKTLYVIEPKTMKTDPKPTKKNLKKNRANSSSNRSSSSSSSMSSTSSVPSHEKEENEEDTLSEASEVVLDKEKTEKSRPVQFPKGKEKRRPSRTVTVRSEVKPPSPHKLKFQRGKVVNPKPENNAPRKLRFKQAKVPSENLKEAGRRSFRRRRVSCGSAAELINPRLEAQAVVLRHQEVQAKKDPQGLFNLVIEETASKLVETKKSKVKALVGAFETVISLQESRVSPTV